MQDIKYANTNEHLYDDIELWEKSEGIRFFEEMPLNGNKSPVVLDFGYGFGEYLFACSRAFPNGTIYGIDGYKVSQKEVSEKVENRGISNVKLINKVVDNLREFQNESIDLMFLSDVLHGNGYEMKYMLFEEAQRIIKTGGCLSVLPFHLSNWRDRQGNKKKYSIKKVIEEISEYGFKYEGTCSTKGIHWEKCHTLYYIKKGNITFDVLERMDVLNFIKV